MKKRDSLIIILEVLRLLQASPANITRVIYRINLNHDSAERYVSLLVRRNLVRPSPGSGERTTYYITDRGRQILRYLEDAISSLFPPEQTVANS